MKNEQIAKITHEVDRTIRATMGQEVPAWSKLEANLKTEWRSKIGALKGDDGITPQARHDTWVSDMIIAGWIQGSVIDHDKKTHPGICQYKDLPDQVHLLDDVFVTIVDICVEIRKNG